MRNIELRTHPAKYDLGLAGSGFGFILGIPLVFIIMYPMFFAIALAVTIALVVTITLIVKREVIARAWRSHREVHNMLKGL